MLLTREAKAARGSDESGEYGRGTWQAPEEPRIGNVCEESSVVRSRIT